MPSFVALGVWLLYLRHVTGYIFGDPGFTHYNIGYALNPVRATLSLLRRLYFLFFSDFRWIGAVAIVYALVAAFPCLSHSAWRLVAVFAAAHILLVSLLGGAALERYLVPVLPLLYCAAAAALTTVRIRWRTSRLRA